MSIESKMGSAPILGVELDAQTSHGDGNIGISTSKMRTEAIEGERSGDGAHGMCSERVALGWGSDRGEVVVALEADSLVEGTRQE